MKNKKTLELGMLIAVFIGVPIAALAVGPTAGQILVTIANFVDAIIAFLVGFGVLYFMWGVVKYVAAGDDATKRTEGRNMMIYGVIALFVMVSVWGLVNLLMATFGLNTTFIPAAPGIPGV